MNCDYKNGAGYVMFSIYVDMIISILFVFHLVSIFQGFRLKIYRRKKALAKDITQTEQRTWLKDSEIILNFYHFLLEWSNWSSINDKVFLYHQCLLCYLRPVRGCTSCGWVMDVAIVAGIICFGLLTFVLLFASFSYTSRPPPQPFGSPVVLFCIWFLCFSMNFVPFR